MNTLAPRPPISADLLRITPEDGSVTLIAGRHRDSGRLVFPCPADAAWQAEDLPRHGSLWSWTVQRFRPKSPPYAGPEAFEPYAVGYVDLGGLIVEGRLTGATFDALRIGMPMRLVALDFALGMPARQVVTYAFEPEGDRA